uniref:Uncharacterized protein n=1 Tax=Anguilla anguilla TaxID=7936 RepID=A0A0E9TAC8_ANGAN
MTEKGRSGSVLAYGATGSCYALLVSATSGCSSFSSYNIRSKGEVI